MLVILVDLVLHNGNAILLFPKCLQNSVHVVIGWYFRLNNVVALLDPHRSFCLLGLSLSFIKSLSEALGGIINDVELLLRLRLNLTLNIFVYNSSVFLLRQVLD